MRKRVYIETSIPSYYCETRTDYSAIMLRQLTRLWWRKQRRYYHCVIGPNVIDELSRGKYPGRQHALTLAATLPLLPVTSDIESIVRTYIRHKVMPRDAGGDALHLALASFHQCHFLLTWNCQHIANANKFEHIRHINTTLGLPTPVLTTPMTLLYREERP